MAFLVHSTDDHRVPVLEYLPALTQLQVNVGMAMKLDAANGVLSAATGAVKPDYICMCSREAVAAGEQIPVIRVDSDMVFETSFAVAADALKLGSKVTLHTDGMQITATTENGVAQIITMDGTAVGDTCRVRFV